MEYLLILVTKKIDTLQKQQDMILIYLGILLAEQGFNLREPQFVQCVQIALEARTKKKSEVSDG